MANKGQMTGMIGVYLVAVELCKRDWIVSVTSRNAAGADLLVTDQLCQNAWSVQVKTNSGRANFWLLGAHTERTASDRHMYVFVNDARGKQPEFVVALSKYVSGKVEYQKARNGSEWFSFNKQDRPMAEEGWEQFGTARGDAEVPLVLTPGTKTVEIPDPSTE